MTSSAEQVRPSVDVWLDERADVLRDRLDELGLTLERDLLVRLVHSRTADLADLAGVDVDQARPQLTDEVLAQVATELALEISAEAPGADLWDLPATRSLPLSELGHLLSGLSEAAGILLRSGTPVAPVNVANALGLMSFLGGQLDEQQTRADRPLTAVLLPPAALARAQRVLTVAADAITSAVDARIAVGAGVDPDEVAAVLDDHAAFLAAVRADGPAL